MKRMIIAAMAAPFVFVAACSAVGYENEEDFPRLNDEKSIGTSIYGELDVPNKSSLGVVELDGEEVENIRPDASKVGGEYCKFSKLDAGEGKDDKGNTCLSSPVGEIAANPVRVTADAPSRVKDGEPIEVRVVVADDKGPLPLNAFTFDASGKAGTTLHEHPGELDADGRPLAHCHLGVVSVESEDALPGAEYNAAFQGVQGFDGDLTATIGGLEPGQYRGDVFCSQPGHLILPTSKANEVQAFDTFDLEVTG